MGIFSRKYFASAEEAREFLIEKIALQASISGGALNADELKALNSAPDEPSTEWGINWDNLRHANADEGQSFAAEMTIYLKSAYMQDKRSGSGDAPKYKSALEISREQTNWIFQIARDFFEQREKKSAFGIYLGS